MPPAEAQIAIERLRNRLLLSDAQALDALARAYGPIWASLEGRIIELMELQQRRGLKAWQVQRLRRYEELLAQVQERVEQYSIYASGRISEAQRAAVDLAGSGTRDVVGSALPRGISLDTLNRVGIAWNRLPTEAFEAFIGISGDGAPLGRLLAPLGAEAREAVRQGIAEGIALGKGPRETARIVKQKVGMPLTRSLTISRTETLRAYREASRLQYGANSNIVKGYRRLAAQDDRVCPACIALDGTLYQTNTPLDAHPNCRCHPAGTLTSGPSAVAASQRFYQGKMITIRTAAGNELSFTPNHPILTSRGWVEGGLLKEGDYVVRSSGEEWTKPTIDIDYQNVPTSIEKIFESFSMVSSPMPTSPEDFHGDGKDSKVHIIRANSLLGLDTYTAFLDPTLQLQFCGAHIGPFQLPCSSDFDAVFYGLFSPEEGIPSDYPAALLFSGRRIGVDEPISVALSPQSDMGSDKACANDATTDIELFGEGILRFTGIIPSDYFIYRQSGIKVGAARRSHPLDTKAVTFAGASQLAPFLQRRTEPDFASMELAGSIFQGCPRDVRLDCILEINVRQFSGHVYNLQTPVGWYIANNIISHNCAMVPETISYRELGLNIPDEPLPGTARDWLEGLEPERQQKILGKARFEGWQRGQFQLTDMAKIHSDPVWGNSAVTKPVRELVA